jgi:RNA polymerase sigma-70 factor (ECF subfamily)
VDAHVIGPLVAGLRRYALALTGDLDRADDLVADALVRAHETDERRQEADPRLRLYGILVDRYRGRPRSRSRCPFLTRGFRRERSTAVLRDLAHWREVGLALDTVGDDERRALLLVVLERFSYGDVARIEGIGLDTVMARISSARAKLTACLGAAPRPLTPENDNTAADAGTDPDRASRRR